MTQQELKDALIKDANFLKKFIDFLMRDIDSGSVIQHMVIYTLTETVGRISYTAGQFNQQLLESKSTGEVQPSKMREALTDIASQHLRSEIEPDDDGEISGDFEGAYDQMIEVARAALKERESE